jgi:hypothetical protein
MNGWCHSIIPVAGWQVAVKHLNSLLSGMHADEGGFLTKAAGFAAPPSIAAAIRHTT